MNNERRIGSSRPAKLVGLAVITLMGLCGSLQAQLVLHVDANADQVWFTGTDTGTPTQQFLDVQWQVDNGAAGFDTRAPITSAVLAPTGNTYDAFFTNLRGFDNGFGTFVTLTFNSGDAVTLTGGGVSNPLSYAAFTEAAKIHLEGLINNSMPLERGTGFRPISVVAGVVPEPQEYAVMAALGLIGFAGYRRWRQRA